MQKLEERSAAVMLKERVLDSMKNELPSAGPGKRLPKPPIQGEPTTHIISAHAPSNGLEGPFKTMSPTGLRFNPAPAPINANGINVTETRGGEIFYGYQPGNDFHQRIDASKFVHVNGSVSMLTPSSHY
jgi:hypothetical protein